MAPSDVLTVIALDVSSLAAQAQTGTASPLRVVNAGPTGEIATAEANEIRIVFRAHGDACRIPLVVRAFVRSRPR
jgi:hypothetical protein